MKFTKAQLSDWKRYENVRNGGRWNMWFPQARAATELSGERYSFVMEHFSELKDVAEAKSEKTARQRGSNTERNFMTEQNSHLAAPTTSAPAAGSAMPSDEEIGKASRQYAYDQGQFPTAVAYQAGARWAREMQRLLSPNASEGRVVLQRLVVLLAERWDRRANKLMSQPIYAPDAYTRKSVLATTLRDCARELRAESEKQHGAGELRLPDSDARKETR